MAYERVKSTGYLRICRKSVEKIQVSLKSDKTNRPALYRTTDRHTYFITIRSVLSRMITFSHKSCTGNQNTHFVFSKFFSENRAVYEIMWENIVERGMTQMTIWRTRIPCWITKATNTHSQYVILIAFPSQQWLDERNSMLRYYVLFLRAAS